MKRSEINAAIEEDEPARYVLCNEYDRLVPRP